MIATSSIDFITVIVSPCYFQALSVLKYDSKRSDRADSNHEPNHCRASDRPLHTRRLRRCVRAIRGVGADGAGRGLALVVRRGAGGARVRAARSVVVAVRVRQHRVNDVDDTVGRDEVALRHVGGEVAAVVAGVDGDGVVGDGELQRLACGRSVAVVELLRVDRGAVDDLGYAVFRTSASNSEGVTYVVLDYCLDEALVRRLAAQLSERCRERIIGRCEDRNAVRVVDGVLDAGLLKGRREKVEVRALRHARERSGQAQDAVDLQDVDLQAVRAVRAWAAAEEPTYVGNVGRLGDVQIAAALVEEGDFAVLHAGDEDLTLVALEVDRVRVVEQRGKDGVVGAREEVRLIEERAPNNVIRDDGRELVRVAQDVLVRLANCHVMSVFSAEQANRRHVRASFVGAKMVKLSVLVVRSDSSWMPIKVMGQHTSHAR